MRLTCPHCGERDHSEFTYRGDAAPHRPALRTLARGATALPAADGMFEYVHLRTNPPGRIRELWHHAGGCRSWVVVERDTSTHAVGETVTARSFTEARAR